MGWVVYSDAVVRSSDAVLVFVVTASRCIGDAVSSHCREILEQCWCRSVLLIGRINRGIAPVAIIDRQLPFEYTIASRSTGVMVMALPILNITHSAFRSMFEKLSGSNFNDLFRSPKMWNAVYDDHNEGKGKGKVKDKSYILKPKNPKPSAKEHRQKMISATTAKRWASEEELSCLPCRVDKE
ncbi:hypothetical protein Tco_0823317 [Tanacetum coccineum]|uniref:Uncharacterized protein n=1 Tax=Tanacetum coccineum TaxID=301880 RepID=A0ABQ5ALX4_9ASTR